ncbi:MAG: tetratricopeptide repeat protein [Selenomonadaceae bacterium]|nr:tetratricopeptide repeat protein [Selenomonadaceae bacterium]
MGAIVVKEHDRRLVVVVFVSIVLMVFHLKYISDKHVEFDVFTIKHGTQSVPSQYERRERSFANNEVDDRVRLARKSIAARSYLNALEYCNKALELEPDNPFIRIERGRAYHYLKKYDEALDDLNAAIAGIDNNEDNRFDLSVAYNARGCVYLETEEYEKARADLNEAVALDKYWARPHKNLGVLYREMSHRERQLALDLGG